MRNGPGKWAEVKNVHNTYIKARLGPQKAIKLEKKWAKKISTSGNEFKGSSVTFSCQVSLLLFVPFHFRSQSTAFVHAVPIFFTEGQHAHSSDGRSFLNKSLEHNNAPLKALLLLFV